MEIKITDIVKVVIHSQEGRELDYPVSEVEFYTEDNGRILKIYFTKET